MKKKEDGKLKGRRGKNLIYHLKISGYGLYWLHVELKGTATLMDLDAFLREIWLECCGHLSQFTIHGVRYSSYEEKDWWIALSRYFDFFTETMVIEKTEPPRRLPGWDDEKIRSKNIISL